MTVRWTKTALHDLWSLDDYVSAQQTEAAESIVNAIAEAIDLLGTYPLLGRGGRIRGTREIVISPFIVVYRVEGQTIEIAAVIHGARRWPDSID